MKRNEKVHNNAGMCHVSIRPFCVEEPAEILAIQFDWAASPMFNADLSRKPRRNGDVLVFQSHCLVDRRNHQVVEFSHFSVKECLASERLAFHS